MSTDILGLPDAKVSSPHTSARCNISIMASTPTTIQILAGTLTPTSQSIELFPVASEIPNHGNVVIDSIAAQLSGSDLSGVASASLVYFPLPAPVGGTAEEFIYPLSFSFRTVAGVGDFITITQKVDCYCLAQTVALLAVEWMGSITAGANASVNLVFTYRGVS